VKQGSEASAAHGKGWQVDGFCSTPRKRVQIDDGLAQEKDAFETF